MRDHLPDALEQAWKWLHAPDYIVYRLTGAAGTDLSLAGRTMAFDIHRKVWCEWDLASAGLDAGLWPTPAVGHHAGGGVVGKRRIGHRAAGRMCRDPRRGRRSRSFVGAAAVGVVRKGEIVDSLGTAESLISVKERLSAAQMRSDGYHYGCHVVPEAHYVLGGLSGSGASLEWWMDRLGAPAGEGRYAWLVERLNEAPEGPTGRVHLPYLRGTGPPEKDPVARGALFGIDESMTVSVWLKATLEGLCAESRRIVAAMAVPEEATVTVIGGGRKIRTGCGSKPTCWGGSSSCRRPTKPWHKGRRCWRAWRPVCTRTRWKGLRRWPRRPVSSGRTLERVNGTIGGTGMCILRPGGRTGTWSGRWGCWMRKTRGEGAPETSRSARVSLKS